MIKAILSAALVLALGGSAVANSVPLRMVVADLPYARVWAAAQDAVRDCPLERVADGEIVTGWRDRPARAEEGTFERVAERVQLRVEAFGERITRITATVEVRGWRDGQWIHHRGERARRPRRPGADSSRAGLTLADHFEAGWHAISVRDAPEVASPHVNVDELRRVWDASGSLGESEAQRGR
jgi:hypothetical protein